jgi:alanine racemase
MIKNKYIGYRPTWAEVDLDNLSHNYWQVKKMLRPEAKILITVKADAYGHGLIPVSKQLVACGADWLGVASIDEGIKLREAGINLPILVLGLMLEGDIAPLFKYRLTPTVCDSRFAGALNTMARRIGKSISVHLKVDTGMGRIGVLHEDAFALIRNIRKLGFVTIEGIFTHLALADTNREFTSRQIDILNGLINELEKEGIQIPLKHAANSIGLLDYRNSHFNMVRPGLVIYGLYPKKGLRVSLKPVLSLKTRVVYVKKVKSGSGISYGHIYVTREDTHIATLPIGYGDGYPRNLSNIAPVLIRGKRLKVSGRICMDQMMVDIGNFKVRAGDEVVLIGSQKAQKVTAENLAQLSGTIPYEIVCGLGSRIPRVYIKAGKR